MCSCASKRERKEVEGCFPAIAIEPFRAKAVDERVAGRIEGVGARRLCQNAKEKRVKKLY